jgi:hypothetical protein
MEGLRSEEARRQKAAILKHFGLTEKTDPKSVTRHMARRIRLYGRHGKHTLFDRLFAGQVHTAYRTVLNKIFQPAVWSTVLWIRTTDLRIRILPFFQ